MFPPLRIPTAQFDRSSLQIILQIARSCNADRSTRLMAAVLPRSRPLSPGALLPHRHHCHHVISIAPSCPQNASGVRRRSCNADRSTPADGGCSILLSSPLARRASAGIVDHCDLTSSRLPEYVCCVSSRQRAVCRPACAGACVRQRLFYPALL